MSSIHLHKSYIRGMGSYLPEDSITNQDLERLVDTNDQWIRERTGIRRRAKAREDQASSDLALVAAKQALKEAEINPKDLDMILFATATPDQVMPSAACELQAKLEASQCMALDISAACSGFIYGLSIAHSFIATGAYKNVLVIGAEVLHRFVNYEDRGTCILFGDGAGAAVVSRAADDSSSQIISQHLHADGRLGDLLTLPAGGSRIPLSQKALDQKLQFVQMKGKELFKHAVRTMSECCSEALSNNNLTGDDVDWIIPHQANVRIIEAVAKHFGVSMDKVIVEIEEMGNTSAATVPVAMHKSIQSGKIKRGDTLLLTAFGAGLTSGSLLMRY